MRYLLCILSVVFVLAACKSHKQVQSQPTPAPSTGAYAPVVIDTGKPFQLVQLPVFIPILELQNQVFQTFFAPGYGKYYPCQGQDCDDSYKNLYLENPMLRVDGDNIVIRMHLAGKASLLFLSPDVSGDITLTAVPAVKHDTLYFQNVAMDHSSDNLLTKIASAIFEKRIVTKIQDNAWYAFRPKLDAMTTDAKKRFPLKWGNICLMLNLAVVNLNAVHTSLPPSEGILADFTAKLTIESADFCGQ